ncbi:MAG: PIN domain-containing protein [Anaerolineales bacterium]|nr:PIN domain-containing protein [Anaerolineales bacterium]
MAEVAAVLSRGVNDQALAHQLVRSLSDSSLIELFPISLPLADKAAALAADHRIRGCDAVYVELAHQLGDVLITLDWQQRDPVPP